MQQRAGRPRFSFHGREKALGLEVLGTQCPAGPLRRRSLHGPHARLHPTHVRQLVPEDFVPKRLAFTAGNGVAAVFDRRGGGHVPWVAGSSGRAERCCQFGKGLLGSREPNDPSSWHHARFT